MNTFQLIDIAFTALERRHEECDEQEASPDVANCDCCDERPGTHQVLFAGMDTWTCDECSDLTPRRRVPRFRSRDEYEAYEAGVPSRGEI